MRWLLIIALLVLPACLTPGTCAAASPAATPLIKKISGHCCKKGCNCAANTQAPSKGAPAVVMTPDIHKIAAAPLPLFTLAVAIPTTICDESASLSQTLSNVRPQSILCLWTT